MTEHQRTERTRVDDRRAAAASKIIKTADVFIIFFSFCGNDSIDSTRLGLTRLEGDVVGEDSCVIPMQPGPDDKWQPTATLDALNGR